MSLRKQFKIASQAKLKQDLLKTRKRIKTYIETYLDFVTVSERQNLERQVLEDICLNCLKYSAIKEILIYEKTPDIV